MSTYLTSFKGEFQFPKLTEEFVRDLCGLFGANHINVDSDSMIYFDGTCDDTHEEVEQLMVYVSTMLSLDHDEIVIAAQGEDIKDRWDIIIRNNAVYIRRYEFVAIPEEPYIKS